MEEKKENEKPVPEHLGIADEELTEKDLSEVAGGYVVLKASFPDGSSSNTGLS